MKIFFIEIWSIIFMTYFLCWIDIYQDLHSRTFVKFIYITHSYQVIDKPKPISRFGNHMTLIILKLFLTFRFIMAQEVNSKNMKYSLNPLYYYWLDEICQNSLGNGNFWYVTVIIILSKQRYTIFTVFINFLLRYLPKYHP